MQTQPHEKTSKSTLYPSCLNHLSHGSTSTSFFIKDEKPEDYLALLDSAFAQFKPGSNHDATLVCRCVHDQWILFRREGAANSAEAALYLRQPDPSTWTESDLAQMTRFARYKTEASRAYERSLYCLKTIKKLQRDEERWQFLLEAEKQRLAIHIERFELYKKSKEPTPPPAQDPEPPLTNPPPPPPAPNAIEQTLFIGVENGKTVIYETTPSNNAVRDYLEPGQQVTRTYNFIGSVPTEYRHLVTDATYTFGKSTCIHKTYDYEDWMKLTERDNN